MHSFQFGMLFFLKKHSQPDNIILEISPSITSLCSTPILWGHVLDNLWLGSMRAAIQIGLLAAAGRHPQLKQLDGS